MSKTKIDWADMVWNPVTGCTKISEGCQNCYAERMTKRLQLMAPKKYSQGFSVKCHPEALQEPLKVKKPQRIFVCSMSDLFHDDVPADFILQVIAVAAKARQHTFIILTKRPARALQLFHNWGLIPDDFHGMPPSGEEFPKNIWFGVTAENQARADERIPILLQIPATVRFVSIEPMLSEIDLQYLCFNGADGFGSLPGLDWVICGGETGPGARPMHPDWVRFLRDQCEASSVPFFFKQWGAWITVYDRDKDDPDWRNCPEDKGPNKRYLNLAGGHGFHGERVVFVNRVETKAAGHMLDGKEHREFPKNKEKQ